MRLALVLALFALAVVPVAAADEVDDNRAVTYGNDVIAGPVGLVPPPGLDHADTAEKTVGCRTVYSTTWATNIFGKRVWEYKQKLGWCWGGGGRITAATPRCQGTSAHVYKPLWDFKGHIGCQRSGGLGETWVRRWRQGKFQACAAWCFQTVLPYAWVRGNGNGSWSRGGGV